MSDQILGKFIHVSQAYYGTRSIALQNKRGLVDEVVIIVANPSREFFVRWYRLNGHSVPRVEIYTDGWILFRRLPELFEELADYSASSNEKCRLTPEVLCGLLLRLGFADVTPRELPR